MRRIFTQAQDEEFKIFMSSADFGGQPIVRASDIVKSMMEKREKPPVDYPKQQ
jgi:hypothetical protein